MSLKGKIPPEVKIQAVEDYLAIRKGSTQIREELGIRLSTFQAWLRKYQMEGRSGLYPKKHVTSYPSSLKLAAVEDYMGGGGSLDAMCRKYGISSHAVLQQWITLYNQGHREFKTRRAREETDMAEKEKLSQEQKLQAVLYCLEHQLDYRRTSEQYKITYQQIYSWVKKYQGKGEAGLLDCRGKRRPPSEYGEAVNRLTRRRKVYEAIHTLHQEKGYEIASLCALSGIPRCSYYKWLHREESASEKENTLLLEEIIRLYSEVKGIYGYRRMTLNVNSRLQRNYNHKRIYRLMKSVHMQAVIRRKKKHYVMSEPRITAENVLNRAFTANRPNEKWLTDVTEFKLINGKKAYLSAILDLHDKSIVAYALGQSNNNQLVFDTFDRAVRANPSAHPLFHSDRGYQYTNRQFKAKLDGIHATQSMSRPGRCIDNGPMEGFWGILKSEMYYLRQFHTFEELKKAIDEYIDFYNTRRLQAKLKGLAPLAYRNQTLVA